MTASLARSVVAASVGLPRPRRRHRKRIAHSPPTLGLDAVIIISRGLPSFSLCWLCFPSSFLDRDPLPPSTFLPGNSDNLPFFFHFLEVAIFGTFLPSSSSSSSSSSSFWRCRSQGKLFRRRPVSQRRPPVCRSEAARRTSDWIALRTSPLPFLTRSLHEQSEKSSAVEDCGIGKAHNRVAFFPGEFGALLIVGRSDDCSINR